MLSSKDSSESLISGLTAILLCGGKGERLKPFTDTLPKPLVPLNGRPLLAHLLSYLGTAGISRFVVCVGYKAETIEQFIRDYGKSKWEITCVDSGDASMTDRIIDARRHFTGRAIICYGDTIANVDIMGLLKKHQLNDALATLTTYPLHSPFGIVEFDDSERVRTFVEKPWLPYWINIGFMLCEPEAFKFLKPGSDMPDFLSALAAAGRLFTHQHSGKHLTVNTEKERAMAEIEVVEFFTHLEG